MVAMLDAEVAVLELDGATKRFGALAALDGCTFRARSGRLTGFLGPNGAGKTTAMRAVFGLVELDTGTVRWRGEPVAAATRTRFGYMPEERGLYPRMRVRDQLVYLGELCGRTRPEVTRSVDDWLERVGLGDRASTVGGPVVTVLIAGYWLSFLAVGRPESGVAKLASYFPATAPLAMPNRIAMGATAWWEPLLAAALTVAAIAGLVVLGGRLYTNAILHTGPTLTLRDAWHGTPTPPPTMTGTGAPSSRSWRERLARATSTHRRRPVRP